MDIRRLPAMQGLVWFRQAIDLGSKNPRAVFGAALLLIASLYMAALLMALVLAALVGGGAAAGKTPDIGLLMAVALPMTLLVMFLVPILLGGLMHVVREAEAGRPVRARAVFAPLRGEHGRRLAWLGLVQVGMAVGGGLLLMAAAGSGYWRDYMLAMQAMVQGSTPVLPEPQHPGLMFVLQVTFNYFNYGLILLAIPLMLFSGCGVLEALRLALRALLRNVAANLLAGALFIGAMLVATLVVALLVTLLAMLGGALHPVLGALLALLVMLGFAAVVLVVVVGATHLAWRDTFGDAVPPSMATVHAFEA